MRQVVLAVAVMAAGRVDAAVDPGLPGPLETAVLQFSIVVDGGASRITDVYFPSNDDGETVSPEADQLPVVAFGHGFSRAPDRYTDFGAHLASRGFLVLIPDFVCGIASGCDHSGNADEMSDVLDWAVARNAEPSSIFFGRIATDRVGTSGHSAGGLQALVCASRDPRVRASAPMDPVDAAGLGVGSLLQVAIPIAITYSEPSSCNANGSSEVLYGAANPQKRGVKIVGATHCDPEKNNDFFGCALFCGSWNATRHEQYLRYVTGWFEYYLHCDASYRDWVWGDQVQSDLVADRITYAASARPPPPPGFTAAWSGTAVSVERDPPAQCAGVDFWRVYRSEFPDGPLTLVAGDLPVSATSWEDASAAAGQDYTYVARDVFSDFATEFESEDSQAAEVSVPASNVPAEASPPGAPLLAGRGPGTAVQVTFTPADCSSDHVVYWGQASGILVSPTWTGQACARGVSGLADFDPGNLAAGTWLYFVIVGNDGVVEGSYGQSSAGGERTEAVSLPDCDFPQQAGNCSRYGNLEVLSGSDETSLPDSDW